MPIFVALLETILYILLLEFAGVWMILCEIIDFEDVCINHYDLIQGFLQLVIVLLYLVVVRHYKQRSVEQPSLRVSICLYAALLGIAFVLFQYPLKEVYNLLFGTQYGIVFDFDGLPELQHPNILSTVIFIPIAEELFFRKYLQGRLQKKMRPPYAILAPSVLFALIHSPYPALILDSWYVDWHSVYLTFFGGLAIGALFYYYKRVEYAIIFHAAWNLVAVLL